MSKNTIVGESTVFDLAGKMTIDQKHLIYCHAAQGTYVKV
jgi:hypothetical protein